MSSALRWTLYIASVVVVGVGGWYLGASGVGAGALRRGAVDSGPAVDGAPAGAAAAGSGEGWQWEGWERDTAPETALEMEHDYVTLRPGDELELRGRVARCTDAERFHERFTPCTLRWDLPGGETATGERVTHRFSEPGFHVVTLTALNAQGAPDPTPERLHVAVWEGEFRDDFDRERLDVEADGWAPPLEPEMTEWVIDDGWLNVTRGAEVPGITALTTWVSARDAHVEVVQRRSPATVEEHYTDVICRWHPVHQGDRYYRVRIWEMPAAFHNPTSDCVSVAVFKMSPERGNLGTASWPDLSRQHSVCSWPRDRDIRIVIDLAGPRFDIRLEDPARPGTALLRATWTDEEEDAFLEPGRFGLTEYQGQSWFDGFLLRELSASSGGSAS